jgi:hypothetical protein
MLKHWLKEFWRQGYNRRAPGFPLALTRILIGILWFSQLGPACNLSWKWLLCGIVGVSLALGLLSKIGAVLGAVLICVYVVKYILPAGDPLWPYELLVLIHLLILFTAAGRNLGLDQLIMEKLANWPKKRTGWIDWLLILV